MPATHHHDRLALGRSAARRLRVPGGPCRDFAVRPVSSGSSFCAPEDEPPFLRGDRSVQRYRVARTQSRKAAGKFGAEAREVRGQCFGAGALHRVAQAVPADQATHGAPLGRGIEGEIGPSPTGAFKISVPVQRLKPSSLLSSMMRDDHGRAQSRFAAMISYVPDGSRKLICLYMKIGKSGRATSSCIRAQFSRRSVRS